MKIHRVGRPRQRGFATLIVLSLLVVMSVFLVNNSRVLHQLDKALDLVDAEQLQKFQSDAAPEPQTNKPARP